MITLLPDLYVVIAQLDHERAPQPRPLQSGFSTDCAYRVLGVHSPSETAEAYLILSNDRDEIWFISNRHVRTLGLRPGCTQLRLSLCDHQSVSEHLGLSAVALRAR